MEGGREATGGLPRLLDSQNQSYGHHGIDLSLSMASPLPSPFPSFSNLLSQRRESQRPCRLFVTLANIFADLLFLPSLPPPSLFLCGSPSPPLLFPGRFKPSMGAYRHVMPAGWHGSSFKSTNLNQLHCSHAPHVKLSSSVFCTFSENYNCILN